MSSVLGGAVVAELSGTGTWKRGYVYDGGGQLLALQAAGVWFVHQDPVVKSQRVTNRAGEWTSSIEVEPWGTEVGTDNTAGSADYQPRRYTTYERDVDGTDEAMMRRYRAGWTRFDQPDPSDGSMDLTNPQSFNRYAYVQNDPVNFTDPSGLDPQTCFTPPSAGQSTCYNTGAPGGMFMPGSNGGSMIGSGFASPDMQAGESRHGFFVGNAQQGLGYGAGAVYPNYLSLNGQSWYDGIGTVTTTANLDWHQRGVLGTIGDFSRGVADSVVPFGIVDRIHQSRGEPTPDSEAYRAGEGSGVVLSMVVPGGGLRGALNASRLGHIFRNAVGHVNPRTLASQGRFMGLFERVATNPANSRGLNRWGNELFTQTQRNGSQVWVEIRGGQIRNAGVNLPGAHR